MLNLVLAVAIPLALGAAPQDGKEPGPTSQPPSTAGDGLIDELPPSFLACVGFPDLIESARDDLRRSTEAALREAVETGDKSKALDLMNLWTGAELFEAFGKSESPEFWAWIRGNPYLAWGDDRLLEKAMADLKEPDGTMGSACDAVSKLEKDGLDGTIPELRANPSHTDCPRCALSLWRGIRLASQNSKGRERGVEAVEMLAERFPKTDSVLPALSLVVRHWSFFTDHLGPRAFETKPIDLYRLVMNRLPEGRPRQELLVLLLKAAAEPGSSDDLKSLFREHADALGKDGAPACWRRSRTLAELRAFLGWFKPDVEKAKPLFQELEKAGPSSLELWLGRVVMTRIDPIFEFDEAWAKDPAGAAVVDEALMIEAERASVSGEREKAEKLLRRVADEIGDGSMRPWAWAMIAQSHLEQKDQDRALDALEESLKAVAERKPRNPWEYGDLENIVLQAVAKAHERRGEYAEAIRWWESWTPRSTCGNAGAMMRMGRQIAIKRCEAQLKKGQ